MARQYDESAIPSVYNLEDIPSTEVREGVHQQVFRGMDAIIGFTRLEPEMEPGPHSHPWEQIAFIYDGSCTFHVGDDSVEVEKGDVLFIPPDVEHYAEATNETCFNLDVWPLREDYLDRTDYQDEWVKHEG